MKAPRVLVVAPPLLLDEGFIDYPFFAGLGAASNAAALRAAGCEVALADAQAFPGAGARRLEGGGILAGAELGAILEGRGRAFDAVVVAVAPFLKPHAPDAFGKGLFASLRARFPRARLIAADCHFGGMHYVEYDGAAFLKAVPEVDALAKYETEGVLPGLAAGRSKRGAVVMGRAAALPPDSLAPPAWDLLPLREYYAFLPRFFAALGRPSPFADGVPTLPAMTSRGCARRCGFCTSDPGQARPSFRPRGLHGLEEEFKRLRALGARRLALLDGCANHDPERFLALLGLARRLGLRCEFPNGLRADALDARALRALRAVSSSLSVSAESADRGMLERVIKKGQPVEEVERVARLCRGLRLPLSIHYVVGCPGETVETANATLEHALRMREELGAEPLVQNFVPIPGSPLHKACAAAGGLSGFDPARLYEGFQGRPALSTPSFPADTADRMTRLLRARLAAAAPRKVIVNLTYHCSNDCRFCAVADRPKRHGDFARYARLLRAYRSRGVRALDLDGGEPTLYPRLLPFIALARSLGYERVTVTTNGRRLADRSFACRFLLGGVSEVLVSLHGHRAEVHERETRRAGSFDETVRGIRHLVRLRPDRVGVAVNTMLTPDNAAHLSDLLGFVHSLGVPKVNVQLVTPFGHARAWPGAGLEGAGAHFRAALERWGARLRVELVNAVPCEVSGWGAAPSPELGKLSRDMAFVDAPAQNLAEYLDARRVKTDACRSCEHSVGCAGRYAFEGAEARA